MRSLFLVFLLSICLNKVFAQKKDSFVLLIHGGAGTILKSNMTPEKEAAYIAGLTEALQKGYFALKNNGTALDAVTEAVKVLEDNPLFNAGKGSVFTNAGTNEMDAAIMDGNTKAAGSVAGVSTIKNPVTAARAVMEKSEHVMLTGKGAEQFAAANNCIIVAPSYFFYTGKMGSMAQGKSAGQHQPANQKTKADHEGFCDKELTIGRPGNL